MTDISKIKYFDYLGKRYTWNKIRKFQGAIDCTCMGCQKTVKMLVDTKQVTVSDLR